MKENLKVSLFDLALTLSNAVDLISPILHNHQKQVAYIAYHLGKESNLQSKGTNDLLIAGLLHDVGGLTLDDRLSALQFELTRPHQHAAVGYLLLKDFEPLFNVATIIKYHHLPWKDGQGQMLRDGIVPLESHMIHLADRIAVLIDKDQEILSQVKYISRAIEKQSRKMFHPELIEAFNRLKLKESFWLDIVSSAIDHRLSRMWEDLNKSLDLNALLEATKIIAKVIDFRSRFTSLHSSGVAAVAEALAQKRNWKKEECIKMKIAGHLHDLGKLAISDSILEKNGSLTTEEYNRMRAHTYHGFYLLDKIDAFREINEYASLHHERLDGKGYPFRYTDDTLKEGSKIMAVADVFTAIKEDRPYRKGMEKKKVIEVMEKMKNNNGLDSQLVSLLLSNFDEIDSIRSIAQQQAFVEYQGFSRQINNIERHYSNEKELTHLYFSETLYSSL